MDIVVFLLAILEGKPALAIEGENGAVDQKECLV